jgi:hypothetical protein
MPKKLYLAVIETIDGEFTEREFSSADCGTTLDEGVIEYANNVVRGKAETLHDILFLGWLDERPHRTPTQPKQQFPGQSMIRG